MAKIYLKLKRTSSPAVCSSKEVEKEAFLTEKYNQLMCGENRKTAICILPELQKSTISDFFLCVMF